MRSLMSLKSLCATIIAMVSPFGAAFAFERGDGFAVPWQIDFQMPATPVMEMLYDMHVLFLWVITAVTLLVLALMIWVVIRFNEKANPVPSKNAHNTLIEIVWTAVPVIILVVLAIPTLKGLYYADKAAEADMTLKVVGKQWYWTYEYPDHGGFTYDSVMIPDDEIKAGQLRLLEVDNRLVVPVDTTVRVLITAADVNHNWAMPAFGIKTDAIPGIVNETWFRATREGTYYGQCSELCGVRHGFMPIRVDVVSKPEFERWVEASKEKYAAAPAAQMMNIALAR